MRGETSPIALDFNLPRRSHRTVSLTPSVWFITSTCWDKNNTGTLACVTLCLSKNTENLFDWLPIIFTFRTLSDVHPENRKVGLYSQKLGLCFTTKTRKHTEKTKKKVNHVSSLGIKISPGKSDLQGAVAAVQVVQTRRVNELFVHASQRLQRGEQRHDKQKQTGGSR